MGERWRQGDRESKEWEWAACSASKRGRGEAMTCPPLSAKAHVSTGRAVELLSDGCILITLHIVAVAFWH